MKVLIIGGTGVISSAVVKESVRQGIDVTCINRGNNYGVSISPSVKVMHFDIHNRDIAECKLSDKHYDVVIDFICYNKQQIEYSLSLFSGKCKQYIFISTDSVYKIREDGLYDETCEQFNLEWSYSYEKSECEVFLKERCYKENLNYTIVRPSITYGNTRIPYGLMPKYGYHYGLVSRVKAGKPIPTWNGGSNVQTMMRVEDFAVGMVGLFGNPDAYNNDFGICGDFVSWGEVLDAVEKCVKLKVVKKNVDLDTIYTVFPERRGEFVVDRAKNHMVSNRKLMETVPSFKVAINIEEGVSKTITYYEQNHYLHGVDYRFDAKLDRLVGGGKFVEYGVGGNPLINRFAYLAGKYEHSLVIKTIDFGIRVVNKLKRIVARLT